MNIRPLTQLREMIAAALRSQTNIGKSFQSFFIETMELFRQAKFRKKTPGVDWFWSGCASAMKKGLEILGISIVDADIKDSIFLKAEQTFTGKKRGHKP